VSSPTRPEASLHATERSRRANPNGTKQRRPTRPRIFRQLLRTSFPSSLPPLDHSSLIRFVLCPKTQRNLRRYFVVESCAGLLPAYPTPSNGSVTWGESDTWQRVSRQLGWADYLVDRPASLTSAIFFFQLPAIVGESKGRISLKGMDTSIQSKAMQRGQWRARGGGGMGRITAGWMPFRIADMQEQLPAISFEVSASQLENRYPNAASVNAVRMPCWRRS